MARWGRAFRGDIWYSGVEVPGRPLYALAWGAVHHAEHAARSMARHNPLDGAEVFIRQRGADQDARRWRRADGHWIEVAPAAGPGPEHGGA